MEYESRQSSGSDSSMAMSREKVLPDEYPAEADGSNSDSEVSVQYNKQREYVGVNFDLRDYSDIKSFDSFPQNFCFSMSTCSE